MIDGEAVTVDGRRALRQTDDLFRERFFRQVEEHFIERALATTGGHVSEAARLLVDARRALAQLADDCRARGGETPRAPA